MQCHLLLVVVACIASVAFGKKCVGFSCFQFGHDSKHGNHHGVLVTHPKHTRGDDTVYGQKIYDSDDSSNLNNNRQAYRQLGHKCIGFGCFLKSQSVSSNRSPSNYHDNKAGSDYSYGSPSSYYENEVRSDYSHRSPSYYLEHEVRSDYSHGSPSYYLDKEARNDHSYGSPSHYHENKVRSDYSHGSPSYYHDKEARNDHSYGSPSYYHDKMAGRDYSYGSPSYYPENGVRSDYTHGSPSYYHDKEARNDHSYGSPSHYHELESRILHGVHPESYLGKDDVPVDTNSSDQKDVHPDAADHQSLRHKCLGFRCFLNHASQSHHEE